MPLSLKTRIEVFIPESEDIRYQNLIKALEEEFTHTFGGCSTIRAVNGNYMSLNETIISENVSLIFTDIPHTIRDDGETIITYAENLIQSVYDALNEESILITVNYMNHITLPERN